MEAWKEELYHWGIKGMKWKKRKKGMSDAERSARLMEGAVRTENEENAKRGFFGSKANLKNRVHAANRRLAVSSSDKNRLALDKYRKKYNSAESKAKRIVKGILSGRAFSTDYSLKLDGKEIARRSDRKAKGGTVTEITADNVKTTRYTPKPKRKKKKR
jgi:hypothetical protein